MHRNTQARPAFYPYCERGHAVRSNDSGNHCPICWAEDNGPEPEQTVADSPDSESFVDAAQTLVELIEAPPATPALVPQAERSHVPEDDTWGLEPIDATPPKE